MVVGGTDGTQSMCTTEVLDAVENAWHPGPTMTFCRGNVGVALVNDTLWAVGGFSGKTFLNNVEFLDPTKEEWTSYLPVSEEDRENEPSNELNNQESEIAHQPDDTEVAAEVLVSATELPPSEEEEGKKRETADDEASEPATNEN